MQETRSIVREDTLNGIDLPITLTEETDADGAFYSIEIDGIEWLITENRAHAAVLFQIMQEHITEYMHYKKL